jgi:hypothetical protein
VDEWDKRFGNVNLTLTVAIVLIVIGVLALLVGMALEATTRSPRRPEQKNRR